MRRHTLQALRRGVEAALVASIPQVLLTKAQEKLLLPPGEDADVGPRFVERLAERADRRLPEDMKWLGASAFHFGYAAFWGAGYALAYERRAVHPLVGGTLLGSLIWGVTFPRWGGAVWIGSEDPPEDRSWRMELALVGAAFSFSLITALIYGRGPAEYGSAAPEDGSAGPEYGSAGPEDGSAGPEDGRARAGGGAREAPYAETPFPSHGAGA